MLIVTTFLVAGALAGLTKIFKYPVGNPDDLSIKLALAIGVSFGFMGAGAIVAVLGAVTLGITFLVTANWYIVFLCLVDRPVFQELIRVIKLSRTPR